MMIPILVTGALLGSLLAIPIANVMFIALTLGLGLLLIVGVSFWAFLGPIAILLAALSAFFKLTSWRVFQFAIVLWVSALMIHTGHSNGRSHWGDVASTIGGKNEPYSTIFWEPVMLIEGWLNGKQNGSA
jgi:hypothetical protein